MIIKIVLSFVGVVVLVAAAGAAYFYYYPMVPAAIEAQNNAPGTILAVPDDTVLTGPVSAITATSISITKQNKATATFTIASDTPVLLASAEPGKPGIVKSITDIKVGTLILVQTSKSDASVVEVILIIPPPPVR
jgi:hypothetical protein